MDCPKERGRFPTGHKNCFRTRNCCAGDRRLRRKQGAGAGPAAAEGKPRPRGAARCGCRGPVQGGAPQRATNSPVDCWLARGRFPRVTKSAYPLRGQALFLYCQNRLGCPYGNRTARPAVLRPARFGQSSGLSERAREIPSISKNIPGGLQAAPTHGGECGVCPAWYIRREVSRRGQDPALQAIGNGICLLYTLR